MFYKNIYLLHILSVQLLSALIIFTAMDMEVVMIMGNVIVIATGVVNLTVQVTYQAHLLICM